MDLVVAEGVIDKCNKAKPREGFNKFVRENLPILCLLATQP